MKTSILQNLGHFLKKWQILGICSLFLFRHIFIFFGTFSQWQRLTALQSCKKIKIGGPFVNWEKNCKGQFCFKPNYFVNPSFLKIDHPGDPISNRSKPIRVLTRTNPSCSDEHLPLGYLLRNFQQNRSNFFSAHPPP